MASRMEVGRGLRKALGGSSIMKQRGRHIHMCFRDYAVFLQIKVFVQCWKKFIIFCHVKLTVGAPSLKLTF